MHGPSLVEASKIQELLVNANKPGEFIYIQLEMSVGDQLFWEQGVLDTGSKRSCVSKEFVESNLLSKWIEENDNKLIGVNGELTNVSETIPAQIVFKNGTSIHHEWIVVESLPVSILIGTDIMKQHGPITLDFEKNTVQDASDAVLLNTAGDAGGQTANDVNDNKQNIPTKIFDGSKLTASEKEKVRELLIEFSDIIIAHNKEAICKNYEASIPILDTAEAFTHVKPYPIHLNYQDRAKKIIDKWLEEGKIERTQSPYNAPVVIVEKKLAEGETVPKLRLCLDYRRLNQNIAADPCITERLNDILAQTTRHKYRSSFDMPSAYLQIPIRKEDRHKTAFYFLGTQYQFTCCPFGLNISGSAFQRCMFALMEGLDRRHIRSYVDDVLLTTETFEEHLQVMRQFFEKVRLHGMTLAYDKMTIGQEKLLFLGMELTDEGFGINPKKVEGISKITELKSKKDARSYLGCLGFFKSHIPAFAEKTRAISDSLQGKNFQFTESMKKEMDEMRKLISCKPVRAYPQLGLPFILYTDASNHTLAYALCQVQDGIERVIHDGGSKIPADKLHLCIFEKELMAVKSALKSERYLLRGAEFILRTDSLAVKNCLEPKANEPREFLNDKVARWCQSILDYRFKIEKIKSEENILADAISRLSRNDQSPSLDKILIIDEDISKSELEEILTEVHDNAGHGGIRRTLQTLRRSFKIPNDRKIVTNWVNSCSYCLKFRHYSAKGISSCVTDFERPSRALERVQVDIHYVANVATSVAGFKYILGIVCELTSYARFYPLRTKAANETAKRIGTFLSEEGASVVSIKTDLGTEFMSSFLSTVKDHGVAVEKATPYWKKKNAIVERAFGKLKACLKSISNRNQRSWVINLPRANMLYNSLPLQVTGLSPFQCVYGHLSRRCKQLVDDRSDEEIKAIIHEKWTTWGIENDKKPGVSYDIDQKVMVRVPPKAERGFNARYGQIYQGPYTVMEKLNSSTYAISINEKLIKKNVAQLRPYTERFTPEEIYQFATDKKITTKTETQSDEKFDQTINNKTTIANDPEKDNNDVIKAQPQESSTNATGEDITGDHENSESSELFMRNRETPHLSDSITDDVESDSENIGIPSSLGTVQLDDITHDRTTIRRNTFDQEKDATIDTAELIDRMTRLHQSRDENEPRMPTMESDELFDRMSTIIGEHNSGEEQEEASVEASVVAPPISASTPMPKNNQPRRSKRDLTKTNAKIKKHCS